jgi:hypothetical protein
VQVWVLLRMHPFSKAMLKPILASVPAGATGWWISLRLDDHLVGLSMVAIVGIGIAIVFGMCLALFGFDDQDRMLFQRFRRKTS